MERKIMYKRKQRLKKMTNLVILVTLRILRSMLLMAMGNLVTLEMEQTLNHIRRPKMLDLEILMKSKLMNSKPQPKFKLHRMILNNRKSLSQAQRINWNRPFRSRTTTSRLAQRRKVKAGKKCKATILRSHKKTIMPMTLSKTQIMKLKSMNSSSTKKPKITK